jgi:HK97 family phage portal protein
VLSFPAKINLQAKEIVFPKLADKFEHDMSGSGGLMILDGGAEWKPLAFSSRDAEFLESRKLTDLAVARIFGVPPTTVGIVEHATYSNADQEARAFVMRCLAPMARRIEQAMNAALLPASSRRTLFIEHDLAGLLRGDLGARFEAYRIGREWGWLSSNEIRRMENMPEIQGGDEYLSPLNMTALGQRGG